MMEKSNTKISYLYRDASNYKVWNEAVIPGRISYAQVRAILRNRIDEFFVPSMVGLPEKTFVDLGYDENEDDHPFFEIDGYARDIFSYTNEAATVNISPTELAKRFEKIGPSGWGM